LGNQVEIADLGDGTYEVSGTGGTTINGGAGPYESDVVTKGIKVDLKGGDDKLDILGDPDPFVVNGDVSIKMGDGEDEVRLENAHIGGKTTVDLGKGPGQVGIAAQCDKDVAVKAGDAPGVMDPRVEVEIVYTNVKGNLSVTTGKTSDQIWLGGVTVTKNVTIKTGDAEDYAAVSEVWEGDAATPSLIEGTLSVDIGKGGGGIQLDESTVKKDVSFKAGDAPVGEDDFSNTVEVRDAEVEGKLTVTLGKGDATVWLNQTVVNKDVKITTNNGDDEIYVAPVFEVAGLAGEGEDDFENFFGGKVTVNSGNGVDQVVVASSEVLGALSVKTGDGEDAVALWQVAAGSTVSINTGNDSDLIAAAELQAAGNVTVNSGNAGAGFNDQVILTGSEMAKNLSVKTGNGDDRVGIGDSDNIDAALADLLAEFGWDGLGIEAGPVAVLGKFSVGTGSGSDDLSIGWCDIAGSAAVDMGSDSDGCEILDTTVGAGASVKMGAGDDELAVWGTDVLAGKVTLDGGPGYDEWEGLDDDSNTFPEIPPPVVKGFFP